MPEPDDREVVRVAEMFGDIARTLAGESDLESTLAKVLDLAVEHLDACEFAGMAEVRNRKSEPTAVTDEVPRILDAIQSEVGDGPCLDAIEEHEVIQTGDLASEERWPSFSRRAHEETGVRSILSVRLYIEEDTMGALNLYSTRPDAFGETDVALASVFAAHAGVAMSAARREDQLNRRAASRDVIGRAKGILMARSDIGDDEAFEVLRRASQRLNIKVVEVAERVATNPSPTNPVDH